MQSMTYKWSQAIQGKGRVLTIFLIAWLSLFAGINTIPIESHESYVLQTAREMGMNNDWVLPDFSGEPRLNKPPLNYWLTKALHTLILLATTSNRGTAG